jgi:hypothetical protein
MGPKIYILLYCWFLLDYQVLFSYYFLYLNSLYYCLLVLLNLRFAWSKSDPLNLQNQNWHFVEVWIFSFFDFSRLCFTWDEEENHLHSNQIPLPRNPQMQRRFLQDTLKVLILVCYFQESIYYFQQLMEVELCSYCYFWSLH